MSSPPSGGGLTNGGIMQAIRKFMWYGDERKDLFD